VSGRCHTVVSYAGACNDPSMVLSYQCDVSNRFFVADVGDRGC